MLSPRLCLASIVLTLGMVSRQHAQNDERKPPASATVLEGRGWVEPARLLTVTPKIAGQLVEVFFEEGKKVQAGDILAKLDARDYEAAVRVARAEVALAEARMGKADNLGLKDDFLIARAEAEVAKARLVQAELRLAATVIQAPVAGVVLAKRAEIGAFLNPQFSPFAAAVCEIADLRSLDVNIAVAERDLEKISLGQKCEIRLDAFGKQAYHGTVSRIAPVADRAIGAVRVRVRITIPDGDERFRPEMGATVSFLAK